MKANVFQCHGETSDKQQFIKTVGVLNEYINKTLPYPEDLASICLEFQSKDPEKPIALTDEQEKDKTEVYMWESRMKT